jgi:dTDP-4-dehydrorhamnose 3,5-epimerase
MKLTPTFIPEVLIIEPDVFQDERGFFLESWNARKFAKYINCDLHFVQDNYSRSRQGVLRGLHYQLRQPQGKLIHVVRGRIFDVAVDIRRSSPTFGQWVGTELSDDSRPQCWIPAGFAHGFFVLSDSADVLYKVTDYYAPEHERCVIWNDPTVGINWPTGIPLILSARDRAGALLGDAEVFP